MTLRHALLRLYQFPAYWLSWLVFMSVGLLLNAVCAILLLEPHRERRRPAVRATIKRLFGAWCAWTHAARMVYVSWTGFTPEALAGSAVYVANHPGLLDATFVLARLPETICIFKPALMRNPALGPAALMAGYVSGDNGVDLIRDVADRLKDGRSLLIFPEGTRTVAGRDLNPIKPGFALIAQRAEVPVRIIVIRAPRDLLPKGWPWWKPMRLPAQVDITLIGEETPTAGEPATDFAARVGRRLEAELTGAR